MAWADSGDPRSLGQIECLSSYIEPLRDYGGFAHESREAGKCLQDELAQYSEEEHFCPTCLGTASLMMCCFFFFNLFFVKVYLIYHVVLAP